MWLARMSEAHVFMLQRHTHPDLYSPCFPTAVLFQEHFLKHKTKKVRITNTDKSEIIAMLTVPYSPTIATVEISVFIQDYTLEDDR